MSFTAVYLSSTGFLIEKWSKEQGLMLKLYINVSICEYGLDTCDELLSTMWRIVTSEIKLCKNALDI